MKFYYQCVNCGKEYYRDDVIYLCPQCSQKNTNSTPPQGLLKVIYDYENIPKNFETLVTNNFFDLYPIKSLNSLPNLRIGNTPLYEYEIQREGKVISFFIKDDSQNPTYSFKDRASAMVSAFAKEKNINTIVAASTGNAGSSIAGICAAQQQKAIIYVPKTAPEAKLAQIKLYGAQIIEVDGNYDLAFDLSFESTLKNGWYNRNTAINPITVEGKKTVSFEIFRDLQQQVPNYIFVPVGDGVIISGVYKGFEDLLKIGIIEHMPTIVGIQAKGSSNLLDNLWKETFSSTPSNTIADSISVDIPRGFYMAADFIKKYNGQMLDVDDYKILKAIKIMAENFGILPEPASAAAFAGFLEYLHQDIFENEDKIVILHTGSGLKDLNALKMALNKQ